MHKLAQFFKNNILQGSVSTPFSRLVTSAATVKSKSKSTLIGQVQVLFKKAKSKSKSRRIKRICKHFYHIRVLFLLLLLIKRLS